eukprot:3063611-Rhodomonas_salina.1
MDETPTSYPGTSNGVAHGLCAPSLRGKEQRKLPSAREKWYCLWFELSSTSSSGCIDIYPG